MTVFDSKIKTIEWLGSCSKMIDQRLLPEKLEYKTVNNADDMYNAIRNMIVRGAPAIGIAGAHGAALAAIELAERITDKAVFLNKLKEKTDRLKTARPTAVNLEWAVNKQMQLACSIKGGIDDIIEALKANAVKIEKDDLEANKKMGEFGASLIPEGAGILTHCNAGALCASGYGTALGVIRSAYAKDPSIKVFADETRPRQQGARLTAWELLKDGIPVTLITDGMCSYFMSKGMIDCVVTGADRIAANGDTANKIGTYTLAIAAKYHNIPFYIAAPLSTIDISIKSGAEITVEERNREEITHINGSLICPENVNIINPAFDVTPNELITGIITEKGILKPDYKESVKNIFNSEDYLKIQV